MRILDKNWPWYVFPFLAFVAIMAGLHFMIRGINQDFGAGFVTGSLIGLIIALVAVGWRRGEMTTSADAQVPPSADEPREPPVIEGYSRRSGSSRQGF